RQPAAVRVAQPARALGLAAGAHPALSVREALGSAPRQARPPRAPRRALAGLLHRREHPRSRGAARPMHVLLTGATGAVGRFIAADLAARGARVTTLGRAGDIRWSLVETPRLPPADALVHAALDHLPGRYRGGEGEDP